MKIAIEGLDGVGKTLVAKYVAEKYNLNYQRDFLENMLNLSEEQFFDMKRKLSEYDEVRSLLFLSSLVYAYQHSGDNVVFDRFILSEYYYDGCAENKEWFEVFNKKLYIPDLTIILYANDKIRVDRIKKRNSNDADLGKIYDSTEIYGKMIKYADSCNMNYVILDTSELTVEEVKCEVDKSILKYVEKEKDNVKCIKKVN